MATIYSRDKQIVNAVSPVNNMGGVTTIASGDTSVVVASTLAASGQIPVTGLGITSVASHQSLRTSVNSVVDNATFVLQVDKATVGSQEVTWVYLSK